ncbi:MAG: hypothetical protein WCT04_22695 [Planctomycetota bacterium]
MENDTVNESLVPPGEVADPGQSQSLMLRGGEVVMQCATLTGWDVFEHMVMYCLTLLGQAKGSICAFYLDDFENCDEYTLRVIQRLIGRSGYTTSDFVEPNDNVYKGFWAWRTKQEQAPNA